MYAPPPRPAARRASLVVLAAALVLWTSALAGDALAHATGPQFVPVLESVEPQVPGLEVGVTRSGGSPRITLTAPREATVEVPGVHGEPFLRIGSDGSYLNTESASAPLLEGPLVTPRPAPAIASEPQWRRISPGPGVEWYDPRAEWAGTEPPPDVERRGTRTTLTTWSIPIVVDGRSVSLVGRVDWAPPPVDAEAVLLLGAAIATLLWWLSSDRTRLARVLAGVAVIAVSTEGYVLARQLVGGVAPLAVAPGLALVLTALPLVWRRDRHATAGAVAFGVYLVAFGMARAVTTGRALPSGLGWVTTVTGLVLVTGGLVVLLAKSARTDRALPVG